MKRRPSQSAIQPGIKTVQVNSSISCTVGWGLQATPRLEVGANKVGIEYAIPQN